MKKKIIGIIGIIMSVCIFFTGCGLMDKNVVLTVNDSVTTRPEFVFFLESVKRQMISTMPELEDEGAWDTVEIEGKKAIEVAKDKTMEQLMLTEVTAQKAKELGFELTEDEKTQVSDQRASIVQGYGGQESYEKEFLEKNGLTDEFVTKVLEQDILLQKVYDYFVEENQVEDSELEEYYNKEFVRVKHILIATSGLEGEELDEAKAKADDLLNQVQNGANFEELMAENTADTASNLVTSPGYVLTHESNYIQEFKDAAFDMEVGEIRMVESVYGYHIMKKYDIHEEGIYELNKEVVRGEYLYLKFVDELEKWKADMKIEISDSVYKSIK